MKKVELTTNFQLLKEHEACEEGYKKLARHLGGVIKYGRTKPINLLTILKSNDVPDMLWCLRATHQDCDKVARLMAAYFAEEVLPIFLKVRPKDDRPAKAIQAARDYANGLITDEQRLAAWDAAWDAAGDAAGAAAWAAAEAAAWDAAEAAWAAAEAAAGAAAWAAAEKKQEKIIRKYLK